MENKKFLTVMAVFDDKTQEKLAQIQSRIIENVGEGTQTMGIPFHLTLGSYPIESRDEVVAQIEKIASSAEQFEVLFVGYNTFSDRVLFVEPDMPQELLNLRKNFECDYANGFEWVPHATLFCGEVDEVIKAKTYLPEITEPICAKIVGIELGEFFPPKKI
ncbi:MAG: 2'-5' RNA ligase family protein, partial [Clostridia bacterium]|nr:2'-5' RNA ligase family protein [Clostridia bacterium]